MRSVPHRLCSLAICWIKAMVSEATLGRPAPVAGLELPGGPESLGGASAGAFGLEDEERLLPTAGPAGEEDEPEAVGWGEAWFLDQVLEEDQLLAEESILGDELGLGAGDVALLGRERRKRGRPWSGGGRPVPGWTMLSKRVDKWLDIWRTRGLIPRQPGGE